jgi:hypothetical protein
VAVVRNKARINLDLVFVIWRHFKKMYITVLDIKACDAMILKIGSFVFRVNIPSSQL